MVLRELIICSGVGFSLFILFSRERVVRQVVFLNSGFMAASFIYSQLYHSFDPTMKLFSVVVLGTIVAIGALLGGVIGILIPKISTGIELGVSIATLVGSLVYTSMNISGLALLILFTCAIVGSIMSAQRYEAVCSNLRTCIIGGLILSLSIDALFGSKLLMYVSDILGATAQNREVYDRCTEQCNGGLFLLLWLLVSVLAFAQWAWKSGLLAAMTSSRPGQYMYTSVSGQGEQSLHAAATKTSRMPQRTFSYPDALEFNYYDPDNMHDLLTPYADVVYSIVQNCAKIYGFQVDSSRNQAEHLLFMLTNETEAKDTKLNDPPQRLHRKMFGNYIKWCDRMGTPPLFNEPLSGKRYAGYMEDMLLWLLVWGEAGNLRHMPECLCFLYHKVLVEHPSRKSRVGWRTTYPGHFLDTVVLPMYDAVVAGKKRGKEHTDSLHYDDFNEFFWSPTCLNYCIFEESDTDELLEDGGGGAEVYTSIGNLDKNGNPISMTEHVSKGMLAAKKTYLEKRSWFHPIFAISRILEWHVISYTLLASLAFSVELQWSWSFTTQVASVVFIQISAMSILWTSLEVWTLFPGTDIPGPSIFGYMVRLVAGYLVFVYQCVYYHWSFRPDGSAVLPGTTSIWNSHLDERGHLVTGQGDGGNFWWWQYLWLSLFTSALYIVQSLLSLFPSVGSSFMTWNNDYWQALLHICYPLSQQYTAKKVHVPPHNVHTYLLFWFSLLALKLAFGYRFVVAPVAVPTLFLYDDYMNFEKIGFDKTCLLMFIWWFPHVLVFLIDLSILYSVWAALVGAYVALIERQGAVRDNDTFRSHFMRSPVAFCQKLMPVDSYVSVDPGALKRSLSTSSITNIKNLSRPPSTEEEKTKRETTARSAQMKNKSKSRSSADLDHFVMDNFPVVQPTVVAAEGSFPPALASSSRDDELQGEPSSSPTNPQGDLKGTPRSKISEFLDARSMRWVVFGRVWNEVVLNLRKTDHLNHQERDVFLFATFDNFSKPIYLPLYQTAGCVTTAVYAFKEVAREFNSLDDPQQKMLALESFKNKVDVTTSEALYEVFELISHIFTNLLGPVHIEDLGEIFDKLLDWCYDEELYVQVDASKITPVLTSITQIMTILRDAVGKRKSTPVVKSDASCHSKRQEGDALPGTVGKVSRPPSSAVLAASGGLRKSVSTGFLRNFQTNGSSTMPLSQIEQVAESSPSKSLVGDSTAQNFATMTPYRAPVLLMDQVRDKLRDQIRNLLQNLRGALTVSQDLKDRITFILSVENGFMWADEYASKSIDELARVPGVSALLFKCVGLLKLRQTEVDPKSTEAMRRMHFFINSLFMDLPSVPTTRYAREYTCMTPFYSEDVLLTKDDLLSKNSDGISTLLYLQTLYRQDWENFVERRGLADDADDQAIWLPNHLLETRMWASYRAQTLFRTVEGMMYTEAAVRLIADLEQIIPEETAVLAPLKFTYVVAAQVYGNQRKAMDTKADDIEFLLSRHPNLRVAYIDSVRRAGRREENVFYSVLIKHEPSAPTKKLPAVAVANLTKGGYTHLNLNTKEVYRIKLPGNPVLGEGKPENQNHAIIFSRGRYVQAMDMNQDGYFEESLKMRNLMQEFDSGCSILGFREHIFTGSVSSVANYMACQELSFVTLGQRVLANPLCARQHYGHPDIFDKFFVMTEGGMSKASKGINLSEDVFAGYNATIRGKSVAFKEYAQVGKGRDVGLQQTYKFEAKLSQGNAEQTLSRDLSRICSRLDFFRLLSFYYGGIGHYIANTMVVFALVTVVYCMLVLALFAQEGINGRKMPTEGNLQLLMAGMGMLQTLPLLVTLTVEQGILNAFAQICYMMISGGPLYFIFHIQTKAYYFSQTLLAGGAMYRPTGRGFVTRHSPFDENFRFFACSHLYLGFDLMCALVLLGMYTTSTQYFGLTWSLWLATVSFLISPFWFNPITFEMDKLAEDFRRWINWMSEIGGAADQAWDTWWREENAFYNKLTLSWKCMQTVQKSLIWGTVALGLAGWDFFSNSYSMRCVAELAGFFVLYAFLTWILRKLEHIMTYALRRVLTLTLSMASLLCLIVMIAKEPDLFRFAVAMYYAIAAVSFVLLLLGVQSVQIVYKMHDYVVGMFLFVVLGILSVLQIKYLQTWLLYHNALSAGVAIEDVLKYARKTKERGSIASDTQDVVEQLKKQLAEQDKLLKAVMQKSKNYGAILTPTTEPDTRPPFSLASVELSEPMKTLAVDAAVGNSIADPPQPKEARQVDSSEPMSILKEMEDRKEKDRASTGNLGGHGSSSKLSSSMNSNSSFDASFSMETKKPPAGFSFSQPSSLPPRE